MEWRGTVPSMTLNCSFMQNDGFEVCERPGICTAPSCVVSTDGKNKIGDAMRIQNTTLMPDACALTWFLVVVVAGNERLIGNALRIQSQRVDDSRKLLT